jgi:energy-coupling factor transport system ATP-binding protein
MEIKFKNVSYNYNENTPIQNMALNNINLSLEEGKIYGIVGPSGAGKTTLIELINALIIPTKGELEVGSYTIKKDMKLFKINDLRFNVGLVFQYPEEQFFQATVKKEIAFGMSYYNYKLESIDKRISEALMMVGLDDSYLERNPFNLSSGEQRRVAIASILVFNPEVIILDEPTVGLDYNGKKKLIKLIKKIKDRYNKTIIINTHDVDMIYQIGDNIIALDKGNIILEGNKYDVFNEISLLNDHHIKIPKIVEFTNKVKEKGIKLGKNMDVKDLIKDIYRHV